MHERYAGRGLQIIAVNLDSNKADAEKFLEATPAIFSLKFDPAGELARKFDVQAMPSSFLLDSSGNILARHLGFKLADTELYESQIKAALSDRE